MGILGTAGAPARMTEDLIQIFEQPNLRARAAFAGEGARGPRESLTL